MKKAKIVLIKIKIVAVKINTGVTKRNTEKRVILTNIRTTAVMEKRSPHLRTRSGKENIKVLLQKIRTTNLKKETRTTIEVINIVVINTPVLKTNIGVYYSLPFFFFF